MLTALLKFRDTCTMYTLDKDNPAMYLRIQSRLTKIGHRGNAEP